MELRKNCPISIAQVEVDNIALTLNISSSEVIQSMLLEVGSLSKTLKPKLKNQKSFHRTFYISGDRKEKYYKLKAVFHARWWSKDPEETGMISAVIVSSPRGVTRKYFFTPQDIQKSIDISLEKGIFGESNVKE